MEINNLDQIFEYLQIKEKSKLGGAGDKEIQTLNYSERRSEIQAQLIKAALTRETAIRNLNIAFYIVIIIVIAGTVYQVIERGSNIITIVQLACSAALFPIATYIEKNVTKQSHIQFIAAFLPDLDPKDAIIAISALYQSLNFPENLKKSMQQQS